MGNRLLRGFLACTAALGVGAANAAVITSTQFNTDRYEANSAPGFGSAVERSTLLWNVQLTSPDPCSSVGVQLSRPGSGPFTMGFDGSPIFSVCNFSINSTSPYNPLALVGNPWTATATDSTGSTSALFPTLADPELLPFIGNITVSGAGLTPTVSWTLPDLTGFDADDIQFRVIRATGGQILNQALSLSTTSFTVPTGVLLDGESYFFRLILRDFTSDGLLENRSNAFSSMVTVNAVSEPGTMGLLGLGLASLLFARSRKRRTASS